MPLPPGWSFDFRNDLLIVDGIESVQLIRQNSNGTYAEPVSGRAFWEVANGKNTSGVGGVDRVWHLHAIDFGGPLPVAGDVIQGANDIQWIVQRATLAGVDDQWDVSTTMSVGPPIIGGV